MLRMRTALFIVSILALPTWPASAGDTSAPSAAWVGEQALDARGCYWYRQQRFCARYCYIEVDGRRFCVEDEREAVPQGPFVDTVSRWNVPPQSPLKLGVSSGRAAVKGRAD
jgi:hypothetical protein